MGTTRAYLYVKNRGFSQEELRTIIEALTRENHELNNAWTEQMKRLLPDWETVEKEYRAQKALFSTGESRKRVVAALCYSEQAAWLPLFHENLCDGNTVCSEQLEELSATFASPILAFSIFDSDILFVSYCDGQSGVRQDYAKPNFEESKEYGDYDTALYRDEFPEILRSLADEEQKKALLAAWNEEDMVFADDRMAKLVQILGLEVVYDFNREIPGFQLIASM